MNVYITLEINGYTQGLRLQPELMKEIRLDMSHAFRMVGCELLGEKGDIFHFCCRYSNEIAQGLYESLCRSAQLLKERQDELHGWNIFIHASDHPAKVTPELLTARLFSLPAGCGTVLTDEAHAILSNTFKCERDTSGWILNVDGNRPSVIVDSIDVLLLRESVRESILDYMEPAINGDIFPPTVIEIVGPQRSGKRHTVNAALKKLAGDLQFKWCRLYASPRDKSPLRPMQNSVDRSFLPKVEYYLYPWEKIAWRSRDSFPFFNCPDHLVEDFMYAYELYLRAYLRSCVAAGLPCILVLDDTRFYAYRTLELVNTLLSRLLSAEKLLPIVIEDTDIPAMSETGLLPETVKKTVLVEHQTRAQFISSIERLIPEYPERYDYIFDTTHGDLIFSYFLILSIQNGAGFIDFQIDLAHCLQFVCGRLDHDIREYIYIRILLEGLLPWDVIQEFLTIHRYIPLSAYEERCEALGFFDSEHCILVPDTLVEIIEEMDSEEASRIREELFDFIYKMWHSHKVENAVLFLTLLYEYGATDYANEVFLETIESTIDRGYYGDALLLIEDAATSIDEKKYPSDSPVILRLLRCKMRLGILTSNTNMSGNMMEEIMTVYGRSDPSTPGISLAISEYQHAIGDFETALIYAKKAVIHGDEQQDIHSLCLANVFIGISMLKRSRDEEALDYFTMASDIAEKDVYSFDYLRCTTFETVALFLFGDLTGSLSCAEKSYDFAQSIHRRDWELFLLFLQGRVYFEIGDYETSVSIFLRCMTTCTLYGLQHAFPVCRNWMIRARVYSGDILSREEINSLDITNESLFFMAEYYYFQDQYDLSNTLLKEALQEEPDLSLPLYSSEKITWDSGFSSIEELVAGTVVRRSGVNNSVLSRLAYGFQGLILAKLGNTLEAISMLDSMTTETRGKYQDPVNRLVLIFHSFVLPVESEGASANRVTSLSKALKNVQGRASRISSASHRISYLRKNRWNSMLLTEANKNHLL